MIRIGYCYIEVSFVAFTGHFVIFIAQIRQDLVLANRFRFIRDNSAATILQNNKLLSDLQYMHKMQAETLFKRI